MFKVDPDEEGNEDLEDYEYGNNGNAYDKGNSILKTKYNHSFD